MGFHACLHKSEGKWVTMMIVAHAGALLFAFMNLAANTAVGLMILLRCSHVMCTIAIKRPDCLPDNTDLKTEEKGEKEHEQSMD